MLEVKVFWTPGKSYLFSGLLGIHFKFSSFVLSNKSESYDVKVSVKFIKLQDLI
jgi:hypothetical protein